MDASRKQKIISILKQNDSASVPFFKTQEQLLDEGYKEGEIAMALYEFPYDGKPNKPKEQTKLQKYYEKNPTAADRDGKMLLKELARRDQEEALTYAAAASIAGNLRDYNAESYYTSRFLDTQGISYLQILAVFAIIMILGAKTGHLIGTCQALIIGITILSVLVYGRAIIRRLKS